jgi:hypothetical protein
MGMMTDATMTPRSNINDYVLAVLPLLPAVVLLLPMLENPLSALLYDGPPTFTSQIIAYAALACFGYFLTYRLVPHIKVRFCLRS